MGNVSKWWLIWHYVMFKRGCRSSVYKFWFKTKAARDQWLDNNKEKVRVLRIG